MNSAYPQNSAPVMGHMPSQGSRYPTSQHGGPYADSNQNSRPYNGPQSSQYGASSNGHGGRSGHGGHGGGHGGHGGGHGGMGNGYSKYSRSSIFVPSTWNMDNSKAGFVDFIGRVVRQLDYQYTSDQGGMHGHYPPAGHGGMGMGGHGAHGGMGMGGHGAHGAHGGMGMGGHGAHGGMGMAAHSRPGMHPAASMISVAHDPYGMFGYPGNISRMNLAHGRAQFSSKSVPTTCPRCKHDIMTLVRRRPNALNIAASAGAVVAGVIFKLPMAMLPLAMLPLQVKALQPKIHYCPRCNYKLGKNVKVTVPIE
ncbi:hypothetical protein IWW40_004871 [Coemansia sp. RSA 1250]|nr:hypothetical protein IWW40_004871 [Coemansia sp. RSA 1250]